MMLCEERDDSEYFISLLQACGEGDDVKQLELVLEELRQAGIEVSSELEMLLRSLTSAEDNAALWSYLKMGLDSEDRLNIETFLEGLPPQEVMCTQMYLKMLESRERQLLTNMKFATSIKDAKRCKDLEALLNLQERARKDPALHSEFALKLEKGIATLCAAVGTTAAGPTAEQQQQQEQRPSGARSASSSSTSSEDDDELLRRARAGTASRAEDAAQRTTPPRYESGTPRPFWAGAGPKKTTVGPAAAPPPRAPSPPTEPRQQQQQEEQKRQQEEQKRQQEELRRNQQKRQQEHQRQQEQQQRARQQQQQQQRPSSARPGSKEGARQSNTNGQQEEQQRGESSRNHTRNKRPNNKKAPFLSQGSRMNALRVLGFPPNARPTIQELKAAYRKGALEWHPDRAKNHNNAEQATEKFQQVRQAFDILQGYV